LMKGRPAHLLFFWDYDTQWGADRSRSPGGPGGWGALEFKHTERLLELHAEYRIPACFAVVGAAALPGVRPYHDPDQIRRIHRAGHEVASHSFRHDWLPGLGRTELRETLRKSREVLEDCIGASVTAFVPPYNQPFDYAGGWSISLSERLAVRGPERTDLKRLCEALRETGYRFCRVAYRPLWVRVTERLTKRRLDRPSTLEQIAGIGCIRVNTPGGFAAETRVMIEANKDSGGFIVIHGHPHSLQAENSQHEAHLVPLLRRLSEGIKRSEFQVSLPRDLT
jgi:peptidoglycan/xylan/chitin deacetylase (PgdA/CDA1 family)